MEREAILDMAQKHMSLDNGSRWIATDDEVVDFTKAVLALVVSPAVPVAAGLPAIPEGWKLVPVVPTHEMVRAACDAMGATQSVRRAIAAAPPAPVLSAEQQSDKPQDQSGSIRPSAAPAGQHGAGGLVAQPRLYSRLMEMSEILRAGSRWNGNEQAFADKTETDVAMLDDILGDALRLAAEPPVEQPHTPVPRMGGNTNPESSPIAEPDTATQAPSESIDSEEFRALLGEYYLSDEGLESLELEDEIIVHIHSWRQRATQAAKPLTDEQIHEIARDCGMYEQHDNAKPSADTVENFARSIQTHLKGD